MAISSEPIVLVAEACARIEDEDERREAAKNFLNSRARIMKRKVSSILVGFLGVAFALEWVATESDGPAADITHIVSGVSLFCAIFMAILLIDVFKTVKPATNNVDWFIENPSSFFAAYNCIFQIPWGLKIIKN